ncbi:hypothetical protein L202_04721 [Cryptococcus amylolentus CBS 6039]|uniref:Uncharacterized protein n=2 Tax=Cryptococcus amylolentus TaxID=104669 RepID=A0A1E3HMH8_9TREE|nr:hypothetical protein L202_04721 [Cryptococcus amylolentus CBS 6039]ODN77550.1 hypothetical protein L202_04721 [Cryptococcus amylolentus CBS 6039]ODO05590.1 hypothetical protein I350_04647 [Cryptococcus amylolentus CBS 6273]OXH00173.1 hypothetical protein C370_07354 [Cryptococcus neoformans var. grubii A1-35-8]
MSLRIALPRLRHLPQRLIHTSRPVFKDDAPTASSTPEGLGFTPHTDRVRELPDLKINVGSSARKHVIDNFVPKARRTAANPNTDADFFSDSPAPQRQSRSPRQAGTPRRPRATDAVAAEAVSATGTDRALPPDVTRRAHGDRGDKRGAGAGSRAPGRERKPKRDNAKDSAPRRAGLPRSHLVYAEADQSKEGLFGKKGLLGATAHGYLPYSKAKHPIPYNTSQTITPLPSTPLPILSPHPAKAAAQSVHVADWIAALSPTIGQSGKEELSEVTRRVLGVKK